MDNKIQSLKAREVQATIDDLNQYLEGNVTAEGLVDTLQDMIKFLNQFIFENKTDNFDLKKYLAEGRLLKEELTPLQQYVYDYEKEVSGEDNAKEFLDGIKKLNTPNDVYDYYAFERNWEGDSDLEGDLENIYNQVLDKFKSKNK